MSFRLRSIVKGLGVESRILEKTNYFEDDMNPDETQTDLANFLKYLDDNEKTSTPIAA